MKLSKITLAATLPVLSHPTTAYLPNMPANRNSILPQGDTIAKGARARTTALFSYKPSSDKGMVSPAEKSQEDPRKTTEQKSIENALLGFDFRVVKIDGSKEVKEALKTVRATFYSGPIEEEVKIHDGKAEQSLTILRPTEGLQTAQNLITWSGTQDWHYHLGQRDLHIFGIEKFSIFVGGIVDEITPEEKYDFVEIKFPAGTEMNLRFSANFRHGFKGDDLFATSFHRNSYQEVTNLLSSSSDKTKQPENITDALTVNLESNQTHLIKSFEHSDLI